MATKLNSTVNKSKNCRLLLSVFVVQRESKYMTNCRDSKKVNRTQRRLIATSLANKKQKQKLHQSRKFEDKLQKQLSIQDGVDSRLYFVWFEEGEKTGCIVSLDFGQQMVVRESKVRFMIVIVQECPHLRESVIVQMTLRLALVALDYLLYSVTISLYTYITIYLYSHMTI